MRKMLIMLAPCVFLGMAGCQSHLIFTEEDHFGLKAQFQPDNPSPVEVSLGYRRGVVAVVPQQSKNPVNLADSVSVKSTNQTVTIYQNPNELMSLYTVFKANVGFGNPTEVHQFLATGMAADSLLADYPSLRDITTNMTSFSK